MRLSTRACAALSFALVLGVASTVSAAPEFLTYEGRNAIHDGQGGERKTVEGVDFWMSGDPPHRYQVLGSLTDRRHETGLIGAIRMSGLDSDIAKAAKAAGGDAVILESEDDDVVGVSSFANSNVNGYASPYGSFGANGFSSGFVRPIKKHDSKYIVVRYLPDEGAGAPPPGPALPASGAPAR
jgi:hypothetical protein